MVGIAYLVASWLLLQITDILVLAVVVLLIDRLTFHTGAEPEVVATEAGAVPADAASSRTSIRDGNSISIADPLEAIPSEPAPAEKSIAVLPFVNMSSDAEQEYFSDGITEAILNRLASVHGLQVAARTSAFSFKGQNQDVREIAQLLGVGNILEGSVRKAGDQVRITAQLIRASDGFHLWSDSYDRKLENIFAIQDDIAGQIAEALQISLGVSGESSVQSAKLVNPKVYDLYLRARALHRQRGAGLLQAIELFQQALDIDPDLPNVQALNLIRMLHYGLFDEARAYARVMSPTLASPEEVRELIDWMSDPVPDPGPGVLEALGRLTPIPALMAGRYDIWLSVLQQWSAVWPEWEMQGMTDLLAPIAAPELMHQYRADPRTKDYLEGLRLPEYWRQVGWPDYCRPIGENDFECD